MTPRKLSVLYLAHYQYLKDQYELMWGAFPLWGKVMDASQSGGAPIRGTIDQAVPI